MAAPIGFIEYAQRHNFEVDTYPGAALGLSAMRNFRRFVIITIVLKLCSLPIKAWHNSLVMDYDAGVLPTKGIGAYFFNEKTAPIILNVTGGLYWWLNLAATIFLALTIGFAVVYIVMLFVRWHNYERDCVTNDRAAIRLKRELLKTMRIKERIRAVNNKGGGSSKNGEGLFSKMSVEDEGKLDALNAIKNMQVFVNTRQSLDDESIERRSRIIIKVPFGQRAFEELQSTLKNFDQIATRMERGNVSFGSQSISADQTLIEYSDAVIVPDKYAFEVVDEDGAVSTGEYQHVYSLDNFVDRQAEIDKKEKAADKWAHRSVSIVDDLLVTMEMPAKRTRILVGATNVQYDYKMSFKLNEQRVDALPDKLDKKFNTDGVMCDSRGDSLSITIPLPNNMTKPINVPTLYREVFG